jgi:hypothetical protein
LVEPYATASGLHADSAGQMNDDIALVGQFIHDQLIQHRTLHEAQPRMPYNGIQVGKSV